MDVDTLGRGICWIMKTCLVALLAAHYVRKVESTPLENDLQRYKNFIDSCLYYKYTYSLVQCTSPSLECTNVSDSLRVTAVVLSPGLYGLKSVDLRGCTIPSNWGPGESRP